jgi:Lon-like ATP-dependent protease
MIWNSRSRFRELIQSYCREAGVRSLQKHLEQIWRKVALTIVEVYIHITLTH